MAALSDARRVGVMLLALLLAGGVVRAATEAPLVDAAERNDAGAVTALLAGGADVNATQPDGATALHWAAHWDTVALVERLLRAGADVNAVNDLGVTPLAVACRNGASRMVGVLLDGDGGADATLAEPSGETALMTCARTGAVDGVSRLLAAGADPNTRETASGQTALMWAVAGGHIGAARALVAAGADPDARSIGAFTPLLFAARSGSLDAARLLVEAGAEVNALTSDGFSPLLVAAASVDAITGSDYRLVVEPSEHETVGIYLLERGADPYQSDQYGMTPLHYSVEMRKPALLRALLAHGADPNVQLTSGLPFRRGDYVGRGAYNQATPFWLAARLGDVESMRVLLDAGGDPHRPAARGVTPLLVASGVTQSDSRMVELSRLLDAVKMLVLDVGADVRQADAGGQTAVHGAANVSGDGIIRFLVAQGADPLAEDSRGRTPHDVATRTLRPRPVTAALLLELAASSP